MIPALPKQLRIKSAAPHPAVLKDGKTGYLVESVEECADRIVALLRHPKQAKAMGEAGRQHIARDFLMPRLIRDELRLVAKLS